MPLRHSLINLKSLRIPKLSHITLILSPHQRGPVSKKFESVSLVRWSKFQYYSHMQKKKKKQKGKNPTTLFLKKIILGETPSCNKIDKDGSKWKVSELQSSMHEKEIGKSTRVQTQVITN